MLDSGSGEVNESSPTNPRTLHTRPATLGATTAGPENFDLKPKRFYYYTIKLMSIETQIEKYGPKGHKF